MAERIEELMTGDYQIKIVQDTLSSLDSISGEARSRFESVIRRGGGVRGFQDPFKAPRPLLQSHIVDRLNRLPEFKFIFLDVWSETQPELRDLVREHFSELQDEFDEDTPPEFWTEQAARLSEGNSEFDKTDAELMTHYTAYLVEEIGKGMILDSEEPEDEDASPTVAALLAKSLDYLRALPAGESEWRDDIPRFAESLAALIVEKERSLTQGLLDDLKRIRSAFASDLEFFGRSADDWNIASLAASSDISEAARALGELETALEAYHAITERADTLAEERKRREQRHELEDDIERALIQVDALTESAVSSEDGPAEGMPSHDETPSDSESETQPQSEVLAELQDELGTLKESYDSLLSSNSALKQDNDLVTDAFRALQGEVAGLNADKQTLAEEAAELKNQLHISESQEIYWRNMYETEMSNKDSSAPEPIPTEIESIKQALELARARFDDKLVFRLNKKSDPDYGYGRPKEVWDALEWLATTYHKSQTGEERVIDLNESIRNTCSGWEYKPNQRDTTFNMYREWYTTTIDGVTYELRKHIGRGISRRDNNVIRIAFEWDDAIERVVVGYIGPHQRNRNS